MSEIIFEGVSEVVIEPGPDLLVLDPGLELTLPAMNGLSISDAQPIVALDAGLDVQLVSGTDLTIDSVGGSVIEIDAGVGVTEHLTRAFLGETRILVDHRLGRRPTVQVLLRAEGRYGADGFGSDGFGNSDDLQVDYHNHVVRHLDSDRFEVVLLRHHDGEVLYD